MCVATAKPTPTPTAPTPKPAGGLQVLWPEGAAPPDAHVIIEKQDMGPKEAIELPAGKYQVRVERPGYEPLEVRLTVQATARTTLKASLKQLPSQELNITSEPTANISLDGVSMGRTPTMLKLTSGEHAVTLSEPGFKPIDVRLTIPGEATSRQFVLTPQVAFVGITSPAGAKISVDERELGVAPLTTQLPVGVHRFRIEVKGRVFEETRQTYEQTSTLDFDSATNAPDAGPVANPPTLKEPNQTAQKDQPSPQSTKLVTVSDKLDPTPDALTADEVLKVLSSTKEGLDEKRRAFASIETRRVDLTEFVNVVTPDALKDELCVRYAERLRPVRYSATAKSSFGNDVPGKLLVNGVPYGPVPFDGQVPWCAKTIQVKDSSGNVLTRGSSRPLDPTLANTDVFEFPGRHRRVSVSLVGDVLFTPGLSRFDINLPNPSFGGALQLDLWGQVFHFALAFRLTNLMNQTLLRGDPAPTPGGDLFLGLTAATGTDELTYRFTVDVGISTLFFPAGRIVNTISINEIFFISLAVQASYMWPTLAPMSSGTTILIGPQVSIGVGH